MLRIHGSQIYMYICMHISVFIKLNIPELFWLLSFLVGGSGGVSFISLEIFVNIYISVYSRDSNFNLYESLITSEQIYIKL